MRVLNRSWSWCACSPAMPTPRSCAAIVLCFGFRLRERRTGAAFTGKLTGTFAGKLTGKMTSDDQRCQ